MLTRRHLLAALAAPSPRYDIVIKNGDVRDPQSNFKAKADVAILNGKIAAVEPSIPAEQARQTIDAKGLYVTPGIVDLHTHIFYGGGSVPGIEADPVAARSGVTTWVDAGSFAYDNATGFQKYIVDRAQVRVYGFVYLYPANRDPTGDPVKWARAEGIGTLRPGSPADVALLAIEDGQFRLVDSQRNAITARQRIVCRQTIARGRPLPK